jgi:succinate dehydrogenase / fumarate reductase, cytochrome b subunit
MKCFTAFFWSSVGKKLFTGLTGASLCGFITVHLAGNMTLLDTTGRLFNLYAYHLTSLGPLLYVAEGIMVAIFLIHMTIGATIFINKLRARPVKYDVYTSAGGASRKTISSTTMIYTGVILIVFLVIHLLNFKYAPAQMISIEGQNEPVKDLYTVVKNVFLMKGYTIYYILTVILLGYHLRHGFWSAFQSLGINHPFWTKPLYTIGVLFAVLMSFGFVFIPAWMYWYWSQH